MPLMSSIPPGLRLFAAWSTGCALSWLLPAALLARTEVPLNQGWQFQLSSATDPTDPKLADRWQSVVVPHDASIAGPTRVDAPTAGGGGFFPTGSGWYRRTLEVPPEWQRQRVVLEFEGVYRHAEVWLDGHRLKVGPSANGYLPLRVDLTQHLRSGEAHQLALRVNNESQPHSRWYTGAGLYRPVRLLVTDPIHVEPDSLWVYVTDAFDSAATVGVDFALRHPGDSSRSLTLNVTIADDAGLPIASAQTEVAVEGPAAAAIVPAHLKVAIAHPRYWSPAAPVLYRAVVRVYDGRRLTDRTETTFGLRTVAVSAERGFLLNDEPVELFGANVHHDHGPLGAAAYAAAEDRKVRLLKAAGFNAVRTAHNPPSTAFLAACDRHGLLVINEAFDGWARAKLPQDYSVDFAAHWETDLDTFVRRDRSHPSVVMWSIGNEVYERGASSGAELAAAMRARIRTLDTTRPITAGLNGLGATGDWTRLDPLFASLDVAGYNYELARHAADHARLPQRVIMSAESYLRDAFASWQAVSTHSYVIGDFVWAGQDYLGEAGIGRVFPPGETVLPHWEGSHFPWHGAATGDLDLIGHRKPVSHYRNIVWNRGETLFAAVLEPTTDGQAWNLSAWAPEPLAAHWTWPGHKGRELEVQVFSRHETVRLYMNDRLLGEKPTTADEAFRAKFAVPYAAGTLRAVGVVDGREMETFELVTAGAPAALQLALDRPPVGRHDHALCFVTVDIVDAQGRLNPHADAAIAYALQGPGEIVGVGSADLTSSESYQANPRRAFRGRALVVVRADPGGAGGLTLTATTQGLPPATVELGARAVAQHATR